jgi:hypothetical protein
MKKYIKCFSQEKADSLQDIGLSFLYDQHGVWYFEDNAKVTQNMRFSKSEDGKFSEDDIEFCKSLNF